MRHFDIPVIVTVRVTVNDDGAVDVDTEGAYVDSEGGPWAFSGEAVAYDTDDYTWYGQLQEKTADDDVEAAWRAAYDMLEIKG